jgi:four helix bundle protein
MAFVARELAMEVVGRMKVVIEGVERRDRSLADQMRRATVSVISNLNEGSRRRGKDRPALWRISAGSAAEIQGQVQTAVIWGYIAEQQVLLARLDRLLGVMWGLTEGRGARALPAPGR